MNKKLFSTYLTIIPLLILGIEMLIRLLGFGTAFDMIGRNIRNGEVYPVNNIEEIKPHSDKDLVGSWKAEDISTTTSTEGDITLTIYNGNAFSEKIVDKKTDTTESKKLRISKSGNFYIYDSRIIFVPFSYKAGRNSISLTELKEHPDKYSESYSYEVKGNQLILKDLKTEKSLIFLKYEKK